MKTRTTIVGTLARLLAQDDARLNLYAKGGEVKLVSLQFNEVARTWP